MKQAANRDWHLRLEPALKVIREREDSAAELHTALPAAATHDIGRSLPIHIEPGRNVRRVMQDADPRVRIGSPIVVPLSGIGSPSEFLFQEAVEQHALRMMQRTQPV